MLFHTCRNGHEMWQLLRKYRYAHRGLHDISQGIPENTMPAFERAAEYGFGAELDVHLLADGELVVLHDGTLKRLCGADTDITTLTASELKNYPILGTAFTPPLFRDVLKLAEGRMPLIVEVKTDHGNAAAVTETAVKLLDEFKVDYCVESFDPLAVNWLRKHRPEICRGQLSCNFMGAELPKGRKAQYLATNLCFDVLTKPDFVAYRCADRQNRALRRKVRREGVQEVSWVAKEESELLTMEKENCVVIFEGFLPESRSTLNS